MDCKKETEKITKFISKTFKDKGFSKAVIGISGGVDSAVVATLLCESLGKKNVKGIMLPCGKQYDILDSYKIAETLEIFEDNMNIEKAVHGITDLMYLENKEDSKIIGNIKARIRMTVLYTLSDIYKALVVGTGNRTELMLGYYTLHGDGACALEPIGHLYKTEVFELAKYLNVSKEIINKPPSAGLWEGQTDEGEIGMSYEEMDNYLKWHSGEHRNKPLDNIIKILGERIRKNRYKKEKPKIMETTHSFYY